MIIRFQPKRLTDGSVVFDIVLDDAETKITLEAISELDAHALAEKLYDAIGYHSNKLVERSWANTVEA